MSCGDLGLSQLFTHQMIHIHSFSIVHSIRNNFDTVVKRIEFDLVFQNYANTPTFS